MIETLFDRIFDQKIKIGGIIEKRGESRFASASFSKKIY